jgi:integrase
VGVYRRRDSRCKARVWWISYFKEGRQHRETTGTTNKRLAEKLLALRKAQILEERWTLPRRSLSPPLREAAQEFLESIEYEKTRSRYRSSINNFLRHFGERIRLREFTPEAIFRFQQKRLQEGARKATVNRDVVTISSLMKRAKKLKQISHNPCLEVERLNEKRERRQAVPLSYEEESRLRQFSPEWLAVLITLLADTGLRVRKEALPLKWEDVLLESDPACIHVRESKSAAGVRAVWLTNHCRDELLKWRATLGSEFSPYVFPSSRIPRMHVSDYKTAWRKAVKAAGLEGRRTYDLRATFASRANSCKASMLTIAHLLGHASTQILPTYVKPLDENTRVLIDSLNCARLSHKSNQESVN